MTGKTRFGAKGVSRVHVDFTRVDGGNASAVPASKWGKRVKNVPKGYVFDGQDFPGLPGSPLVPLAAVPEQNALPVEQEVVSVLPSVAPAQEKEPLATAVDPRWIKMLQEIPKEH